MELGAGVSGAERVVLSQLVLQKIANHLPPEELRALRRTCRLWNSTMVPIHRRTHHCLKMYDRLPYEGSPENERVIDYTRLMRSGNGTFPYSRFEILPPTGAPERTQTLRDFYTVCGESINSLWIQGSWESGGFNMDDLRQTIFGGAGVGAPNLDELIFHVDIRNGYVFWNQHDRLVSDLPLLRSFTFAVFGTLIPAYRDLLVDILARAANLERLSLEKAGRDRNNLEMLQAVWESMGARLGNLIALKMDEIKAPELQILIEWSNPKGARRPLLRLKEFCTSFVYVDEVQPPPLSPQEQIHISGLFYQFLVTQSNTLKKLDFEVSSQREEDGLTSEPIPIPMMKVLQQFTFRRRGNTAHFAGEQVLPPVRFQEVTMARNFPCLRSLKNCFPHIIYNRGTHDPELNARIIASDSVCQGHPGVKELVLEGTLTDQDVASLIRGDGEQHRFPSVTHLEVTFISSRRINDLSHICGLTALTVLRLQYKHIILNSGFTLDELLTGIKLDALSGEVLAQLKDEVKSAKTTEGLRLLLTRYQTGFGVNNLQSLLELTFDMGDDAHTITDIGGYLGFAQINPGVQIIALCRKNRSSPPEWQHNEISVECRRFIRSVFSEYAVIDI